MSSLRRPSLTKRIVSALSVAVFVISPITLTNNAIAAPKECDTEFYAANDIVTYDPCAVVCSTLPGGVTMEDSRDTAEAVFKFLISNPFSTNADQPMNAVQAAGFMGNMFVESGIDPATIQGHAQYNDAKARNPSVGGYALGLVQWDSGRRVQLIKYAESKGKEWSDLATQLSFLHQELETTESALLKNTSFRAVKDPGEAATIKPVPAVTNKPKNIQP